MINLKYRIITTLLSVGSFYSCSENSRSKIKTIGEKYNGVYLSHGLRRGQFFTDNKGTRYGYTYTTVTLNNDTIIPFNIHMEFPKEYDQYQQKYKVFLIRELETDENELNDEVFLEEARSFLENRSKSFVKVDKIIYPGEESKIRIGILYPNNINDDIGPAFSILLGTQKPHFPPLPDKFISFPDSLLNQSTTSGKIDISVALFLDRNKTDSINLYNVIHCGNIAFIDN